MGELDDIRTLLQSNLGLLNSSMQIQQQMIAALQKENIEFRERLSELAVRQVKDPLKVEVINKFRRNRKRMIKTKIMDTIRFNALTIPEIKEIIVDQYNYCSKATFYRYIEELQRHDFLHVNDKEIVKIKPLVESI